MAWAIFEVARDGVKTSHWLNSCLWTREYMYAAQSKLGDFCRMQLFQSWGNKWQQINHTWWFGWVLCKSIQGQRPPLFSTKNNPADAGDVKMYPVSVLLEYIPSSLVALLGSTDKCDCEGSGPWQLDCSQRDSVVADHWSRFCWILLWAPDILWGFRGFLD